MGKCTGCTGAAWEACFTRQLVLQLVVHGRIIFGGVPNKTATPGQVSSELSTRSKC